MLALGGSRLSRSGPLGEFDQLREVVAGSPLGVDEDGLRVLRVVLQTHPLHLLDLDDLLEPCILLRALVQLPIVGLLLVLLLLLSDLARLLLAVLATLAGVDPLHQTLLLDLGLVLALALAALLLLLLLSPPWHDDAEDVLTRVCQMSQCGHALLEQTLRVSLRLEHVLLLPSGRRLGAALTVEVAPQASLTLDLSLRRVWVVRDLVLLCGCLLLELRAPLTEDALGLFVVHLVSFY